MFIFVLWFACLLLLLLSCSVSFCFVRQFWNWCTHVCVIACLGFVQCAWLHLNRNALDDIEADVCISLSLPLSSYSLHFYLYAGPLAHISLPYSDQMHLKNMLTCKHARWCIYGYAMGPQHIQMGRKTKTKPTNEENNNKNGDIKWEKRLPMQNIDCTQFTWQHAIQGCYLRLDHSMNNQRQHSITAASPNTTVSKSSGQYKKRADDKSEIWPLRT